MTLPPSLLLLSTLALHHWSALGPPQRTNPAATTSVSCKVTGDWGPRIAFAALPDLYRSQVIVAVTERDGVLTLPVTESSGTGYLHIPGSPLLPVEWRDGECVHVKEPPTREVCGRVKNSKNLHGVSVFAGQVASLARSTGFGRFCALVPPDAPLEVYASRFDGQVVVVGSAPWDPASDGPALVMMPDRQGGIGLIVIEADDGAFVVERTVPGMPAARAGIQPGDTVRLTDNAIGDVGGRVRLLWESPQGSKVLVLERKLFRHDPYSERTVFKFRSESSPGGRKPGWVLL